MNKIIKFIKGFFKSKNNNPDFIIQRTFGILETPPQGVAQIPKPYGERIIICPKCKSKNIEIGYSLVRYCICNDCKYEKLLNNKLWKILF